ncbi:sensor histidine kinase [Microbacterium sp. YY-03]|uniref:sensor histidine kinase n=1 Tax=Microbacterium sp. YY-03 TaxID=3421636 RepID=UPI003D176A7E
MTPRAWSLQTRLTTVVVGIVSALLIVVSALTAAMLNSVLEDQLTTRVSESSRRAQPWIAAAVQTGAPDAAAVLSFDAQSSGPGKFLQPGTILILDLDSGLTGAYLDANDKVQVLTKEQIAPLTGMTFTVGKTTDLTFDAVGTYRVMAFPVDDNVVLIGLPRADVDRTIGLMLATITALTLGGLILLALAIGVTIRTSLRPLRAVAATAGRVAQQPLDQGAVAITDRVPAEHVDDHTEVGQVGLALNTMLDHVDASLRARVANEDKMRQFVADASHELRTPLASIRGYSELSLRDPSNSENTTAALERIQAQSVRMTRLVEDLLLLARLDEGQELVLSPVDLVPLTIESIADAQAADSDHTGDWSSDLTELLVLGDAGRLHQVVTNLLANARTHTPAGTHIVLSVERDGDDALVHVHDNGPGIAPEVQKTLFERFARADRSRARNTGGTGLGLAIAQAIAIAHRGELSVESKPGSTTFTLRLPALPEVPAIPAADAAAQ